MEQMKLQTCQIFLRRGLQLFICGRSTWWISSSKASYFDYIIITGYKCMRKSSTEALKLFNEFRWLNIFSPRRRRLERSHIVYHGQNRLCWTGTNSTDLISNPVRVHLPLPRWRHRQACVTSMEAVPDKVNNKQPGGLSGLTLAGWGQNPGYMMRKIRKFRTDKFDT